MNERKKHRQITHGDEILEDIYDKLCDIYEVLRDSNKTEEAQTVESGKDENLVLVDIAGDNKYVCQCGKRFDTEKALRTHITKKHGSNIRYKYRQGKS